MVYHLEWENRDLIHQREIRIIPKWLLSPEVRRFYLFFFGGGVVRLERVFHHVEDYGKWRDRGYEKFQAIEKHARTRFGYLTVRGIDGPA